MFQGAPRRLAREPRDHVHRAIASALQADGSPRLFENGPVVARGAFGMDAEELARGRRDLGLTMLRVARLVGGVEMLARRCGVSRARLVDWIYGVTVPGPADWAILLGVARRHGAVFSHAADAYVEASRDEPDGEASRSRRISGFVTRGPEVGAKKHSG